jgi:hypothetical protein
MNRAKTGFIIFVVAAVCCVATQAATPTPIDNTYVSYRGVDTNPCTRVFPCRTVTQALTVTNSNGAVHVIDTGEYAGFSVNANVTIVADPGVAASVSAVSGYSVVVNGGNVALKNLQILNATYGIFISNGNVIVDDVTFISNLIDIQNYSGATLTVRRCHFNGNHSRGGIAQYTGQASVKDSEFDNYDTAILVVYIYNGASSVISRCIFTNNSTAISGPFTSSGDNVFYNNSTDITQAPTPATIH